MNASGSSRRRVVVAGAVVVAVLAAGALLVRVGRPGSVADGEPEPLPAEFEAPGTHPRDDAPPGPERVRFAHTEAGAAMTAVRLGAMPQRWLYLADDEITAVVEQVAAPGSVERLTEEILGDIRAARVELARSSGRVWWLVHPLAWRVERFSDDSATVAVWIVTVLSAVDVVIPQTGWRTATFDLAWIDGQWRLDGMRDTLGPTPATGPDDDPWDAEAFDDALVGFTRLDGEPVA